MSSGKRQDLSSVLGRPFIHAQLLCQISMVGEVIKDDQPSMDKTRPKEFNRCDFRWRTIHVARFAKVGQDFRQFPDSSFIKVRTV
ncbi:hypothetical protein [Rhizobium leucaenae]|uniref:hypothetical protein n=1 Tax=Rhizobium leucaenae TaxID=29450 RepID=UPI0007EE8957|nr:hypothetical protein [Rhizobium leucaenae]